MATQPAFAATPLMGVTIVPATNDTSLTAPTNHNTILTAGTNGSKIEEIFIISLGTTVAGRINIFLYNGTTYSLIDQFLVPANTPSTSDMQTMYRHGFPNLFLPTSSWSLVCTVMETGNESLFNVVANGGSF